MNPIDDAYQPTVNADLTTTWIDDQLIVLNEAREQVHKLNESAAFLFELCRSGRPLDDIKSEFAERYQVDRDRAGKEAHDLLQAFFDLDLIR